MVRRRCWAVEVDAGDVMTHRLLAALERRRAGDVPVAFLAFSPGTVELVHTAPSHRRRGIAAGLLGLARDQAPGLTYPKEHTLVGASWATAVGLDVPAVDALVDDASAAWAASAVYLYLTHVGAEQVLWRRPLPGRGARLPRWGRR